jgi:thioredoxin-like negative regulator of GroEL
MGRAGRRLSAILVVCSVSGAILSAGWRAWDVERHRSALAEIEEDMDTGRHGTAARKLNAILARRPESDEALYLLGACEKARGQTEPADRAWSHIPAGSAFADRAIQARVQLRLERGQMAEAEQIVQNALSDPRNDSSGLTIVLGPVFCHQGRLEETLRLIEARWDALDRAGEGDSEEAIKLVRTHVGLRQSPVPIEAIRATLDRAGELTPEDDRVWLGKANLAIRIGAAREADGWLNECLRKRPRDIPVWRARLDWALATKRVARVREALQHLPGEGSTWALVRWLAAWLAAHRGDRAAERRALERLIAADSAQPSAWKRLTELALQAGAQEDAAALIRKKAEIDQLEVRYRELHARNQPIRDAAKMARLAERLGRLFEAKAFMTVAAAAAPAAQELRRELARLNQRARIPGAAGRTLADLVATELDAAMNPF